jgi:hypothetical protein
MGKLFSPVPAGLPGIARHQWVKPAGNRKKRRNSVTFDGFELTGRVKMRQYIITMQ